MRLSKRYSIDPADITKAVTLLIMADAEDGTAKAAQATANRKAAVKMQSEISMYLATL